MTVTILAYSIGGLALIYNAVSLFAKKAYRIYVSAALQGSAAVLLLTTLIIRSVETRFVALTGMFDSLIFFSMMIFGISTVLLLQKKTTYPHAVQFGVNIMANNLLLIATSPLIGKEALPPIPALQSGWLLLHVSFSFIGEAFLLFGFVTSLFILIGRNDEKIKMLDTLSYKSILVGYSFFTLGALIFGMIWAESAWGRFWGWDPKETWALITWLIYSVYLHFRLIKKRNAKTCSWISVIGFTATMFTFFGVNYLVRAGLHSY